VIKDLPYPYTSKAQYERSLQTPVGTEWNTRLGFQRGTLPRVVKKVSFPAPGAVVPLTHFPSPVLLSSLWSRCHETVQRLKSAPHFHGFISMDPMETSPHERSLLSQFKNILCPEWPL
jgi:hypothetical protein